MFHIYTYEENLKIAVPLRKIKKNFQFKSVEVANRN